MSSVDRNSEYRTNIESLETVIDELQAQLFNVFKSNALTHDYTLLNGFLTFTHSKLNKIINDKFNYFNNSNSGQILNNTLSDVTNLGSIVTILKLSWEKLWYPIFKWFQSWRKSILMENNNKNNKNKINYVEFRKMNSNLNKFAKSINDFYTNIMKNVLINFNTDKIISKSDIIDALNIPELSSLTQETNTDIGKSELESHSSLSPILTLIFQSCIIYLGCVLKYKATSLKNYDKYVLADFNPSMKYFELAIKLIPSLGESYFQRGLVYIQCDRVGLATYDFFIGSLASMSSRNCLQSIQAILYRGKESSLNFKIKHMIGEIFNEDLKGDRIVNREIIEYYFIGILGSKISPESWIDSNNRLESTNINIKRLEMKFYEKVSTRYFKNINLILKDLLVTIYSFHLQLILLKKTNDINSICNITLDELKVPEISLLKFAFKFINIILESILLEKWNTTFDSFEYLGMLRIILYWLQSNKAVKEFSQSEPQFCNNLAKLINAILKTNLVENNLYKEKILKDRFQPFEEEILLQSSNFINVQMSGFCDKYSENYTNNLDEKSDIFDKLNPEEKSKLRLESIIILGKEFLRENKCDIKINKDSGLYIINFYQKNNVKQMNKIVIKLDKNVENEKAKKIDPYLNKKSKPGIFSFDQIEAKLKSEQQKKKPEWGYSGSTVPVAPSNINVKPSMLLTNTDKEEQNITIEANVESQNGASSPDSSAVDLSLPIDTKQLSDISLEMSSLNDQIFDFGQDQPQNNTPHDIGNNVGNSNTVRQAPMYQTQAPMVPPPSMYDNTIQNNSHRPTDGYYIGQQMPVTSQSQAYPSYQPYQQPHPMYPNQMNFGFPYPQYQQQLQPQPNSQNIQNPHNMYWDNAMQNSSNNAYPQGSFPYGPQYPTF